MLAVDQNGAPALADGDTLWKSLAAWYAQATGTSGASGADWVAVVPTHASVASVAFALFQSGIERNDRLRHDFSRSDSKLPVARRALADKMREQVRARLCATILAARAPGTACPASAELEPTDAWLARLATAKAVRRDRRYWLE
ncbi:MAG: hypothetical protein GY711_00325 [bacterium]|nr:hypothetical protein [bacterium]